MSSLLVDRSAVLSLFEGKQAIILDLDGTIHGGGRDVEATGDSARVTGLRLRHQMGTADPYESFARFDQCVRTKFPAMSKSEALSACFGIGLAEMNRFRETHESPERFVSKAQDVALAIRLLKQRFRLVLATNNSRNLALRIVKCLGLDLALFEFVQASEDVGTAKPGARFFTSILDALRLPASAVVSVGDGLVTDIAPARALGMGAWQVRGPKDVIELSRVLVGASS